MPTHTISRAASESYKQLELLQMQFTGLGASRCVCVLRLNDDHNVIPNVANHRLRVAVT